MIDIENSFGYLAKQDSNAIFTSSFIEKEECYMMNILLDFEGFKHDLLRIQDILDGIQYLFRFENHYGASVVKHRGSYGIEEDLWELAVIEFIGESDCYTLTYDTSVTSDVIGYLNDKDVRELLQQIKEL